jgi:hypothetical protein
VQQTDLAAISLPILGVAGSADLALTRLRELKMSVPQLEVAEIQGAGHQAARLRLSLGRQWSDS